MTGKAVTRVRKKPVFVDVFAGCGGLSLGLKRAGWKGLFAIEGDPFAFETLQANFLSRNAKFRYSWPRSIERRPWKADQLLSKRGAELSRLAGKVDLLAGGPPCQGFSNAGKRRADDPRNRLFEDYLKLVSVLRPRLVLVENVQGFRSDFASKDGGKPKNFAAMLVERLSPDYETTSAVIRASDFGVPQVRPRFFLVGVRRGEIDGVGLTSFFSDLASNSSAFLALRDLPRSPSSRDAISDLEVRRNGTVECDDSEGFLAIGHSQPRTRFQKAMRGELVGQLSSTRLAKHRHDIADRFGAIIKSCRDDGRLNVAISSELRRTFGLKKRALRVLDPLRPAPTITSLPDDLLHYSEPRTLTVRENARLQTFPDWFAFKGKYTTGGHRRRVEIPRFTQVANAVPPLLAEQLGLALLRLLRTPLI